MTKALYRKYRSKTLNEIVGQNHVTSILAQSLKQGRIAHAYLLTGPRGVGKTSIARILAHEINGLPYTSDSSHLDIIEIDAASNNGVEDVRDLRDKVQIAPVKAKHKVYIIDEVHMLSKAAFNALLKTLEEPPEHIVFILATTDVDKLPATVVSRTQRFTFRLIPQNEVARHLRVIADAEGISIDDEALDLIALRGEGSFRDSISLLDQLQHLPNDKTPITKAMIEQTLGLAPETLIMKILDAYSLRDLNAITSLILSTHADGLQATVLATQLIQAVEMRLVRQPELLPLLDDLMEVHRSSYPHIKLLTTLAKNAAPKPKNVALQVSAPSIHAAVPVKPSKSIKKSDPIKPSVAKSVPTDPQALDPKKTIKNTSAKVAWNDVVGYMQQNYTALHSIVSKCSHEFSEGTLTIYTGNAFYKKKLDDAKYRSNLMQALAACGTDDIVIETIGTPSPPKDSQAAAIAAIMGGGEEVSVDA